MPVACCRQSDSVVQKSPFFRTGLCWRYLFSRLEASIVLPAATCRWHVAGKAIPRQRKSSTLLWSFMLALPIFPASHPASIVGASELNFCVRDGNRWTLTAINTNSISEQDPINGSLFGIGASRMPRATGIYPEN